MNTATPKAQELADANGIDIQTLNGGEDDRVTLSEVKAAVKALPSEGGITLADVDVVFLGLGNSQESVQWRFDKFSIRYPEKKLLVQSQHSIKTDREDVILVEAPIAKFVREYIKVLCAADIAINGEIRGDKDQVLSQLRGCTR